MRINKAETVWICAVQCLNPWMDSTMDWSDDNAERFQSAFPTDRGNQVMTMPPLTLMVWPVM